MRTEQQDKEKNTARRNTYMRTEQQDKEKNTARRNTYMRTGRTMH
jgi:hypothetical protein